MAKEITYTGATNGSGAKARQESARQHMGVKGGGLLGRLAGRNGKPAVYKGKTKNGNSGSNRFSQMQSELGYDPGQCTDECKW